MAIRDVLWACPICRVPGGIGPGEACRSCGTTFRRGRGARIVARTAAGSEERPAAEWLQRVADVPLPGPRDDGSILGPEAVRVKTASRHKPLYFGRRLLGWVEVFERPVTGMLVLRTDALHFRTGDGSTKEVWELAGLRGIQPASSALQLALPDRRVASVKFLESSVRLWARVLTEALRADCRRRGLELLELQPTIRTCVIT